MTDKSDRDNQQDTAAFMPISVYMMANWKRALTQQANQFRLKYKLSDMEHCEMRELARAYLAVHECDTATREVYGLRTNAAVPPWVTLNAP